MTDKSVSFIRSLCAGQIEEEVIFPFPKMKEEERELVQGVIASVDDLLGPKAEEFAKWDVAGEMPEEFIEEMKAFGLFGLIIPEEQGGMGFGNMAYSRTLQQISHHDASVAVTVGAHSSIGMRGLKLFGTDEQKARYYEKLCTGEMIAAFCLTEAGAGSDAAAVKTTAEEKDDHYLLNGSKIWITNGGFADFFTVFAKTGEKDGRSKLSAFIVTRDMEGVSTGPHEDKMGIRGSSTVTVYFEDVKVPKENLLGEKGDGFKVAMAILNSGRSGLGGGAVGGMKMLIKKSATYAMERKQFGEPIGTFGSIKEKIANMVVDCYATEAAVTIVAHLSDEEYEDYSVEAAITKVFASEALWRAADEALQIAGGTGYMKEYPYERVLRDVRINRIFEGANEILHLFIALTALNDVGQGLKEMSKSLKGIFDHPIKGFGLLQEYARKRAGWATGIQAFDPPRMERVHESLRAEAVLFESLTRELATMADRLLRKHGKKIIGKQFATRRMAKVMIDLFMLACTLSRVSQAIEEKGAEKAAPEVKIAKVFAGQVKRRCVQAFNDIDRNTDELMKELADFAYEHEGYIWDVI
ncbi:MAG: acyl-CoA dehydrogenase family protein [Deltaproteobacteria bacterium]|nr:acyl-CoA dehydrogenase family protein [Deltaproteobacteria bacterium]